MLKDMEYSNMDKYQDYYQFIESARGNRIDDKEKEAITLILDSFIYFDSLNKHEKDILLSRNKNPPL